MSVLAAARTLGAHAGWSLTNLHMQKILYVAQMIHIGRFNEPAFEEHFEAWSYGPVVPALYHKVKDFRDRPVAGLPGGASLPENSAAARAVREAYALTSHMTPGELVTYLHRPGGAWKTYHRPGVKGCAIPVSAILSDWERFSQPSEDALEWANQVASEIEARSPGYLSADDERAFGARVRSGRLQ